MLGIENFISCYFFAIFRTNYDNPVVDLSEFTL